jgi:uncharacterized protein YndB with AHSA1/START domain
MLNPLRKPKQLHFERTYPAPIERVWDAWTQPELLRRWWGPDKTTVVECEIDLAIGGTIHVVTEAGAEMGKYEGTRWPMSGTFTRIGPKAKMAAFGMKWGYKAQLDALEGVLT